MDEKWIKLEGIKVPDVVWKALRDNSLVIFAGADISMAPPANLPAFRSLVREVAQETGVPILNVEMEEEFFGRLKDRDIDVHALVERIFSKKNPKPTETHKNILRLYPKDKVRVVTTNFDLLFERAVREAFGATVDIEAFDAPALPSGKNFSGIVHLHGSVNNHDAMVLTDKDFGRAYLTEGGSRRFLVDLFNEFTVLFIGYSYNYAIMVNLARSLPRSEKQRFVLIGEKKLEQEYWEQLGVTPIVYNQLDRRDHVAADRLIHYSANLVGLGALDWQRKIGGIAKNPPSRLDEKEAGLIKIALGDKIKTRFFARFAASYKWIGWLDKRGYLDPLFSGDELEDKERELSRWMIEKFLFSHSDHLFSLIREHHIRLNLIFWYELGLEIGLQEKGQMDKETLSKWISVLLSTMPENMNISARDQIFWELGKQCNRYGLLEDLLRLFDSLVTSQLTLYDMGKLSPSPFNIFPLWEHHFLGEHHSLNVAGEDMSKPKVGHIADAVLNRTFRHLEERYSLLKARRKAKKDWDIAPDKEDAYWHSVNELVAAARDSLELLASKDLKGTVRWCNYLFASEAPLLHLLAVHAVSRIEGLSADEKVAWLLKTIDSRDQRIRNEVLQEMKRIYPDANQKSRAGIVWAILSCESEREQHDRLYWLRVAVPSCGIVERALERVQEEHPELREIEFIDLIGSAETEGEQAWSFWTAERLLEKPLKERFQGLLTFKGEPEFNRCGLVRAVQEAANSDFAWGMKLAKMLGAAEEWRSDLWKGLMRAWAETRMNEVSYSRVLGWLSKSELHLKNPLEVAQALRALVENGGTPYAFKLLPRANRIAKTLWSCLDKTEKTSFDGWLISAIRHPEGVLTLFWLMSLSVWRKNQESAPESMSDEYRDILSEIVQDRSLAGKLGRTILAGQFSFLLDADEKWTKDNILPLFDSGDDFQSAWDSFLTWGHLTPDAAQTLNKIIFKAAQEIGSNLIPQKNRFLELYVIMLENFVKDHEKWIANLFDYGNEEVKHYFAFAIQNSLRQKDLDQQRDCWRHWLKGYWENRLDNIPAPLSSQESERMLNWLLFLESVFPEAVDLACRMPLNELEDGLAIYNLQMGSSSSIYKYPGATAKLMIGLRDCSMPPYVRGLVYRAIQKIPKKELPLKTIQELGKLEIKIEEACYNSY